MRPLREASIIHGDRPPLAHGFRSIIAVREVCPPRARYDPQNLQALTLFLTESGTATVYADGVALSHEPGSLVLLARGTRLHEVVGEDAAWSTRYLLFDGPLADDVERDLRAGDDPVCRAFSPPPVPWRDAFLAVTGEVFRGGSCNPWALLSWCAELLGAVVLGESRAGTGVLPTAHGVRRSAERLMSGEPERFWSVREMATALGVPPRRLADCLKTTTGLAPAAWMRRQRVLAACRLMESGGVTVAAAAERTGFANPYHFSRVFKAETGQTPSAFRHHGVAQESDRVVGLSRRNLTPPPPLLRGEGE